MEYLMRAHHGVHGLVMEELDARAGKDRRQWIREKGRTVLDKRLAAHQKEIRRYQAYPDLDRNLSPDDTIF